MNAEWIVILCGAVVAVFVINYLVKSFMKFVLIAGVIYLLFQLGFVWGVDDLNEKLHLDRFLNSSANSKVQSAYGTFAENRDKHSVVNTEEVQKVINDTINQAIKESGNQISKVDKQALLKSLEDQLKKFDAESVNSAIDQSKDKLNEVMTPEQIEEAKRSATNP